MKRENWLLLCVLFIAMFLIGCEVTKMEVSDLKIGKATVLEKRSIPGGPSMSFRICGGGPGKIGFGTGGVGIGLGSGLQLDLDPHPDRFVIALSFDGKTVKKEVLEKKFGEIKPGTKLAIMYREKRWIKNGQVVRTEHWIEKIK